MGDSSWKRTRSDPEDDWIDNLPHQEPCSEFLTSAGKVPEGPPPVENKSGVCRPHQRAVQVRPLEGADGPEFGG